MEILWETNKVTKVTVCSSEDATFPPVHQDDADGKESNGGGEEIGCRNTVEHHLSLVLAGRTSGAAVAQGCSRTCSDEEVGVVAVKHQALRKVALPEAMGKGVRERRSQKSSSALYKLSSNCLTVPVRRSKLLKESRWVSGW